MEPECSVVIPAYNAAGVISHQLDALVNQVEAPIFEVVVADNRSTDDLDSVIALYRGKLPVRVVPAMHAQGVSAARNAGVAAAQTDTLLICDADDIVSPDWVALLTNALRDEPFVGGPVQLMTSSGGPARWVPVPQDGDRLPTVWDGRAFAFGGNMGFRREVFDRVGGFDESFPAGAEEIDFAWRAADCGYEPFFVPGALISYRIRSDLRGVLRQQWNSGRGTATLYAKVRPSSVVPKSRRSRLRHELMLLRRFPMRGGGDARRAWLSTMAFEAGKLVEAWRLGAPAP